MLIPLPGNERDDAPEHDRPQWNVTTQQHRSFILVADAFARAGCRVRSTAVVEDHELAIGELEEVECTVGMPLRYGLRRFSAWERTECSAGLGGWCVRGP
ncbi:flavin reductase [Saccharopolyspora phatthalungensis]|uniref:Flavin reductase (DIM6/NTAB) family NADH-FMN oxidoreductase RutF n=1 Tax=Saccharopolyspora phatthalungensis TaxID=664693 RepID=A0A840Q0Y2_9PSEU|nr:flavin reductase [Saccharopolyspora phatthalungensis]MBB5153630.1 flavin reductase (DIM6/NTAB) family NADH-FMN oxidoreductase RutF [Saccharopolyspora phatthalungensis]